MKLNFWTGLAALFLIPLGLVLSSQAVTQMQHGSKIGVKLVSLQIQFADEYRVVAQTEVDEILGSHYRVDDISKRVGEDYWLVLEVPSTTPAGDLAVKLEHLSGVEKVTIH